LFLSEIEKDPKGQSEMSMMNRMVDVIVHVVTVRWVGGALSLCGAVPLISVAQGQQVPDAQAQNLPPQQQPPPPYNQQQQPPNNQQQGNNQEQPSNQQPSSFVTVSAMNRRPCRRSTWRNWPG